MPKHLQLQIPEPCHENWDQMTPSEKGRFCGSCQKQVVDFTSMSETQLISFFRKKSSGSVCGRFMDGQLDKEMLISRKRMPWINYFFKFILPLFFATKTYSQGNVSVKRIMDKALLHTENKFVVRRELKIDRASVAAASKTMSQVRILVGKISNEKGEPVSYASIMVSGPSSKGEIADSLGVFSMFLSMDSSSVLEISAVGYESKQVVVTQEQIKKSPLLDIQLNSKSELPPVTVVSYGTTKGRVVTGMVMRVKAIKESASKEKEKIIIPAMVVYPNPVISGSSVNIKCDKLEEGYYSFRFLSMTGQPVSDKEIWIDKEASILNIPVPAVASGAYVIILVNRETGKRFSEKVVIQ